jgi:excisionase family DNA binding protein
MNSRDFYRQPPAREVPVLALRPRQAAEAIGVSESFLERLAKEDGFPVIRLGRAVLYPVREVADWLTSKTEGAEQ